MTVTIRAARPEDAEAIAVMASLPGVRHGTLRLPFTTAEDTRRFLERPNKHAIVAERGDVLVGQASLIRDVGRRAHVGSIGIYVHDDHVGQGIGRALMEALIDLADNWLGLRRLELGVVVDNAPAIHLYESLGFEREGRLRGDALRNGVLTDSWAMARLRGAPPFG